MIIGVDGNEANIEKRVGVNVYAFELLRHIYELVPTWKNKFKFVIYLNSLPRTDMPAQTEYWRYKVIPGRRLWIVTKLMPSLLFDSARPDLFFTPSHYVPPIAIMPLVCSIMDLGYLESSGQFRKFDLWQLKLWSAWSMFVSKAVLAISEATKKIFCLITYSQKVKSLVFHLHTTRKSLTTRQNV